MPDTASMAYPGADPERAPALRKRPRPGERRMQILQTLAAMLETPGGERVTTANLAARLEVSEAALYRHFASKAQMFEGLIDFIEQSVFSLIQQITGDAGPLPDAAQSTDPLRAAAAGRQQAARIVTVLLQFAEKNPGMARVMVGDALVYENERLLLRMNQFFDKVEASLRQCLRASVAGTDTQTPTVDVLVQASLLNAFIVGKLQRFARTGFHRCPSEHLEASLALML